MNVVFDIFLFSFHRRVKKTTKSDLGVEFESCFFLSPAERQAENEAAGGWVGVEYEMQGPQEQLNPGVLMLLVHSCIQAQYQCVLEEFDKAPLLYSTHSYFISGHFSQCNSGSCSFQLVYLQRQPTPAKSTNLPFKSYACTSHTPYWKSIVGCIL